MLYTIVYCGFYSTVFDGVQPATYLILSAPQVPRYVTTDNPVILDSVFQEYTPWETVDDPGADHLRSFIEFNTDPQFVCPTDIVARAHALAGM